MVLLLTKVVTFRRQAAAAEVPAMTDVLGCLERWMAAGRDPGEGHFSSSLELPFQDSS